MNSQDVPTTEESQPQRRQEGLPVSERLALSVEKPARCWAFPEILLMTWWRGGNFRRCDWVAGWWCPVVRSRMR